MPYFFFGLIFLFSTQVYGLGNHPEASTCPKNKPFVVFCSHSLHNLEGWVGQCFSKRDEALNAALKHAQQEHNGNDRWTGVLQTHKPGY